MGDHSKLLVGLDRTALVSALLTPLLLMHAHGFAEASVSVTGVCFLGRCGVTRDWRWLRTPWVAIALAWWGWTVICSLPIPALSLGESGLSGLAQGLMAIRLPLFAAALAFGVLRDDSPRRWMFGTIATCAAYVAVHLVFQFVFGVSLYGVAPAWNTLLTGPFGTARAAPLMARILPPVIIPFAARYLDRPVLPYAILMGGLAVVAIIGQRIPEVIMVATLAVAALLIQRMRPIALAAFVLIALLIPSFALISPKTYEHMVTRTQSMAAGFATGYYGEMYNRAFEIGRQNPLTGLGFDGFKLGCPDSRYFRPSFDGTVANGGGAEICWNHPHNYWFQALADGGVPGLGLFAAFALACLIPLGRGLWRAPDAMRVGLFATVLAQLFPVQSAPSFWTLPMSGWFYLLLGWAMAETYGRARQP
jgi:O-Antigen ligase